MRQQPQKNQLETVWKSGYAECFSCGGLILSDSEWLGEDENGRGWYLLHERCEDCGQYRTEHCPE